jgi:hypothetical protein
MHVLGLNIERVTKRAHNQQRQLRTSDHLLAVHWLESAICALFYASPSRAEYRLESTAHEGLHRG